MYHHHTDAGFSDSVNARVLTVGVNVPGPFTVEGCTQACFNDNFPVAGMEFAAQCCKCLSLHIQTMSYFSLSLRHRDTKRWCAYAFDGLQHGMQRK